MFFLSLPAKPGVAIRHVSCVLAGIGLYPPIRHVIAFTRENIGRLNCHTGNGSGVLVPAVATMNGQGPAPSSINLIPFCVSERAVITLFNQGSVRVCFESLTRFGLILIKGNTPNSIGCVRSAFGCEILNIRIGRLFGPYRFCVIKIKEMFRLDNLGSGCGNTRYLQEDK